MARTWEADPSASPRPPALAPERGERLTRDAYKRDFREREASVRDTASWKLERRQHFEEQGSPSREALRRGAWEEALALLEDRRDTLRTVAEEDARRGHAFHRVRVVDQPLTPYVQWELHSHRQHAEHGERIRVVTTEQVASAEAGGPLPEIVVLGGSTLFQVLYDDTGATIGAIRWTDPDAIKPWARYIEELYGAGEDIASYFDREVTPLQPPRCGTGQGG
ncbi:DUF6879 family protein [Streptomyces cucumeris]|uniref:DUF6879 family protein n=1 Tax=Streptomyces cucumeris TaxID=2962890 RepID=UPI0020C8BEF6|nr:DUF6879 family protein [Streptomyces sp. NEAU-Y11]MCP9212445.1 hypothetical protein [Streptomyces sp. NEAU-Y11]